MTQMHMLAMEVLHVGYHFMAPRRKPRQIKIVLSKYYISRAGLSEW